MEFSNLKFLEIFGNNKFKLNTIINLTNYFKKLKYFFLQHKFTTKSHSNIQTHLIKYKITIPKSTHVY